MKAYPLHWPEGWPRTPSNRRKRAKFSKGERQHSSQGSGSWMSHKPLSVADATQRVRQELERLGVPDGDDIVSTNLQLRLDGYPRSGQAEPEDSGAAVYWVPRGSKIDAMQVMAIDLYDRVADNLAAVAATLEAMRAIERHGGAQILDRAFKGFLALPAPGQTGGRSWREVLDIGADETSIDVVRSAFMKKARKAHPDTGGSHDEMVELNLAMQQAEEALA